jgi:outer membrane receptor protein involved in Fe transport
MKQKTIMMLFAMTMATVSVLDAATISGFVTRKDSSEPLQYVNVRISETKAGTQTNKKGYYVMTIPSTGKYTLTVSMISYSKVTQPFEVKTSSEEINQDIALEKSSIEMEKVTVTGNRLDKDVVNTPHIKVSTITQTTEDIINTVSVAEADVFRSILTLPGVTPISDFSSGLYVRGGSPDQNLILLDDIDVYNPNHFGGIFSTFNTDAVESVELIKGGYPAKYGGRLSSVLDVTNRQGNRNYHQGVARLSLISASTTLEGPWDIGSEKGSYMGSFRRTYLDVVKKAFDLPDYYFYDGHCKLNWDAGSRDKLSASMYFGKDNIEMDLGDKMHMDWGNKTLSTQWVHIFNPTLFSHFVLAGSNFASNMEMNSTNGKVFDRRNSIDDATAKQMFSWKADNNHQVDFGFEAKFNDVDYLVKTRFQIDPNSMPDIKVSSLTGAAYIQDIWDIDEFWTFQPGLRISDYNTLKMNLPACPKASYFRLEPRLSLRRKLDVDENIYINYGRYYQYLTCMSMAMSTPFDLWFPLDGSLKPGKSDHFILGYKNQLSPNFNLDFELYYKTYNDILEYNTANDYTWNNQTGQLKDTFHVGDGYTYGFDTLIKTNWNGIEGFLGYTLSKTQRKMNDVNINPQTNEPEYYCPTYDKTHQLNIVETYNFTENTCRQLWGGDLKFGLNYSYSTGQPTQTPEGIYDDGEQFQIVYSYKDRVRLPAYNRLDLSIKNEWTKSWGTIEPYFEVINVLNHKNIGSRYYYIGFDDEGNGHIKKSDSGQFPLIPFIGVNVKW